MKSKIIKGYAWEGKINLDIKRKLQKKKKIIAKPLDIKEEGIFINAEKTIEQYLTSFIFKSPLSPFSMSYLYVF